MTETPQPKWTLMCQENGDGTTDLLTDDGDHVGTIRANLGLGLSSLDIALRICESAHESRAHFHATGPRKVSGNREPWCVSQPCGGDHATREGHDAWQRGFEQSETSTGPGSASTLTGHVGERHASSIRREDCPTCSPGSASEPQRCPRCGGAGRVSLGTGAATLSVATFDGKGVCPDCRGTGLAIEKCPTCEDPPGGHEGECQCPCHVSTPPARAAVEGLLARAEVWARENIASRPGRDPRKGFACLAYPQDVLDLCAALRSLSAQPEVERG